MDFGSAWPIPIYLRVVRSVMPGQVVISGYNSTMGNWVGVYNFDENLLVTYWHLASRNVKVGQWVRAFHKLGRVGNTGNSSAAHLHVQVNYGPSFNYDGHIHPARAFDFISRDAARKAFKKDPKHPNA
jgi:murein DD-endopeptidase MepM/ murein hydrolase activator NlpD